MPVREATDFLDELRSFIELSISESQAKSRQQLGHEIAKAVQVAFEKNVDQIVTRIRSAGSSSLSESAESYSLNVPYPKERLDNARPHRDRELSLQPPPAYETPNQINSRPIYRPVEENPSQALRNPNPPIENVERDTRARNTRKNPPKIRQNYNAVRSHTKIYEWGLSYEGLRGPTSVEDFIFRVEYLQNHYR